MGKKIKFENAVYDLDDLHPSLKKKLEILYYTTQRMTEMKNLSTILQDAKKSHIANLKKEVLAHKAGLTFDDD